MNSGSSQPVDERFTAFADASRRTILSTLCERSSGDGAPAVSIETLTTELASDGGRDDPDGRADGGRVPGGRSPSADAKVELVHVHLPALERAGLAERDDGRVRLVEDPAVVERGLELAETFR
ncbi:hypothetical protein SAMN04488063_0761 [Halopelagius inordinatus]|uniref:ArsR family transcriptional regulator n=1 Tax=Halopelagius inordinatus TaxID=553467 RepID=A0A1I2MJQ4_9EURY|nr:hypothetical protein [Halopelagius inordinatus]SFF91140.1 hypothetical protein SAMN04488063_0761 [Halopelagius inordinatus]